MTQAATTNAEQSLRVDMAAGFRWLQRWEMDDLAAGSLVARLPDNTDWMFTHTQGVFFNEVRASDLFKVGFDLEALDGSAKRSNHAAINPAKWIFEARPEINTVVSRASTRGGGNLGPEMRHPADYASSVLLSRGCRLGGGGVSLRRRLLQADGR